MSTVILLTGAAGAGKTAVANYLADEYAVNLFKFAQPLKNFCYDVLDMTASQVDGKDKELPLERFGGKTPRYIQQTLGTEWGRNMIDSDIWANLALRELRYDEVASLSGSDNNYVFDDTRFPNEIEVMKNCPDFRTIVVKIVGRSKELNLGEACHASESHDLPFDILIANKGELEELHKALDDHLGEILR